MQYIYAALILHKSGKEITEEGITKILEAAGIDVDASRVKQVVAALADIDIDEALSQAVMAAPVAAAGAPAGGATAAAAEETKKEEEEEEEISEEDVGLGNLFG